MTGETELLRLILMTSISKRKVRPKEAPPLSCNLDVEIPDSEFGYFLWACGDSKSNIEVQRASRIVFWNLSEIQQKILFFSCWRGMSRPEISRLLGKDHRFIWKQENAALKRIKELFLDGTFENLLSPSNGQRRYSKVIKEIPWV